MVCEGYKSTSACHDILYTTLIQSQSHVPVTSFVVLLLYMGYSSSCVCIALITSIRAVQVPSSSLIHFIVAQDW